MFEIRLVRGDTETFNITYYKGWDKYIPNFLSDGDLYTLTARDLKTNKIVLQKQSVFPNSQIKIEHQDTKELDIKGYRFDVEYRKPDYSIVKTLLNGMLYIDDDVTYGE